MKRSKIVNSQDDDEKEISSKVSQLKVLTFTDMIKLFSLCKGKPNLRFVPNFKRNRKKQRMRLTG